MRVAKLHARMSSLLGFLFPENAVEDSLCRLTGVAGVASVAQGAFSHAARHPFYVRQKHRIRSRPGDGEWNSGRLRVFSAAGKRRKTRCQRARRITSGKLRDHFAIE